MSFRCLQNAVTADGYLAVVFYNEPVNNTTIIFPQEDGFGVLYRAGTFEQIFYVQRLLFCQGLFFLQRWEFRFPHGWDFPWQYFAVLRYFLPV